MWKWLYLITSLMIGLLILVSSLPLSSEWEGFWQGVIVIAGLGIVTVWLEMNPTAYFRSPSHKSGLIIYESSAMEGDNAEEFDIVQPYPGSEDGSPQLDHRRILDLAEERKENLKCALN